ncbi:MAG: hypothetical protein K2P84_11245, partial [Undibacterium sp.]|nr:hypothetical protein [Undibacterium sp.]
KGAEGHKLDLLFGLLSDSDRIWFIEEMKLSTDDFTQKLTLVSKAFIDWRYVYEKPEQDIDYSFLSELAVLASTLSSSPEI